jgi:hypothetical protein
MKKTVGNLRKEKINFTQVSNIIINDKNLSAGAKGVFMYLMSKPDGWKYYIDEIVSNFNESKYAIKKYIKELELNGYLLRKAIREDGKFQGWDYYIYHSPQKEVQQENITRKEKLSKKTKQGLKESPTVRVSDRPKYGLSEIQTDNSNTNKDSNTEYSNTEYIPEIEKEIEKLYLEYYPLKKGKVKGIKKAISAIKKKEIDLNGLKKCIMNYAEEVKDRDKRYIKHFSTFMNGDYLDYLNVEKENEVEYLDYDKYRIDYLGDNDDV